MERPGNAQGLLLARDAASSTGNDLHRQPGHKEEIFSSALCHQEDVENRGRWEAKQHNLVSHLRWWAIHSKGKGPFQQLCEKGIPCSGFLSASIIKSDEHSTRHKIILNEQNSYFLVAVLFFSYGHILGSYLRPFKSFNLNDFQKDSTYFISNTSANKWHWFPNTK